MSNPNTLETAVRQTMMLAQESGIETRVLIPSVYEPDINKYMDRVNYHIHALDLATARTDFAIETSGNFFQIMQLSDKGQLSVSFNKRGGSRITFDGEQHIFIPFYRFFVTNTAQAGKTVQLFIGNGCFFVPSYRTKMISPDVSKVQSFAPAVTDVAASLTATWAAAFAAYSVVRVDIFNDGGDTAYIGDATVDTLTGFPVIPGQFYSIALTPHYLTASVFAVAPGGSSTTLRIKVFGSA